MQIDSELNGGVKVLRPHGPLVSDESDGFASRVREARNASRGRYVIDMTDLHFVDSAGLEALLELSDEANAAAMSVKLAATNETVREVFDLTGMTDHFELFTDVHSAVRSFL
jgi:anti-anti-sigma factor